MAAKEPDVEFKDYLFINRLNLSSHSKTIHTAVPHLKISRSTWTKKMKRQKENEERLQSVHHYFQQNKSLNSPFLSHESRLSTQAKTIHISQAIHQITLSAQRRIQLSTQKAKQTPTRTHFTLSRNVYNGNADDLSNSGILMQKMEQQNELAGNSRPNDQRLFLKSLKIKNNVNLYKGNFSKFTKKEISHCLKSKRRNLISEIDLSPWENDNNVNFFA